MTVVTGNQCKNMPVCFLRHTISYEKFECRFRVHVNIILNIQTEHEKAFVSSKVVTCSSIYASSSKILQNFQELSDSKRNEFGNNACEKQWVECVHFSRFTKKLNPTA